MAGPVMGPSFGPGVADSGELCHAGRGSRGRNGASASYAIPFVASRLFSLFRLTDEHDDLSLAVDLETLYRLSRRRRRTQGSRQIGLLESSSASCHVQNSFDKSNSGVPHFL